MLGGAVFHQRQAALQGSHATRDGVGHIGHTAQRRNQHQHGADESHKAADGNVFIAPLPQGDADHRRQGNGRHQLGGRCHGCRGDGGLDIELLQLAAEFHKTVGLGLLRTMQAHHAVGQHIFFHHIGQCIGSLLAALGDAVQAARQGLHDPAHGGNDEGYSQRKLPVQIQQIAQQRDQRETIA